MEMKFTRDDNDGQTQFEILGDFKNTKYKSSLIVYTTCIKTDNGNALLTSKGQHIPEILSDGTFGEFDEVSFISYESVPTNAIQEKKLTAEITMHCYDPNIIFLNEITYGKIPNDPIFYDSKNLTGNSIIDILGQNSQFSIEDNKNKKIDFIGSGVIIKNITANIIYATYYIGSKKNSTLDNLGRISLEILFPEDFASLERELYHKEVSEALDVKISKISDLVNIKLYPFLCVFANRTTNSFILECK